MENTLENKEKFFALYWGQNVLYVGGIGLVNIGSGGWNLRHPNFFLELKPLSSISDEDSNEVAKIFDIGHLSGATVSLIKSILSSLDGSTTKSATTEFVLNWLSAQDFLRSKGYALPWMGLSVEQLINYGWIKLKK